MSKDEKKKSKKNRKDKDRKRSRSSTGTTTTTTSTTTPIISSSASKKTPKRIKKEDSSSSTAKKVKVESTLKPTLASTSKSTSTSTSTKKKTKSKVFIKQLDDNNTNSTDSSQLRVQVASDPSTSAHPVVVSFPAGLPPSMTSISSTPSVARSVQFEDDANNSNNNNSSPPVFTWSKVRQSSTRGRLIYGTDDTCTYISSNEGRGHDSRLTKFYVGVYHKPTGSIKFIPSSEKGTVFALNQSVTSYNDSKSMDFRNLSIAERRRMVFESFGSQKKKKVLKSQQANIVEMRSVVGAGEGMMKSLGKQMDGNMMSDSNVKVMEELKRNGGVNGSGKIMTAIDKAYAEARRSFLPPFDDTAEKPYKVYDSQEVAGEEAWSQMSRVVKACILKGEGDEWKELLQGRRPWPQSTKALLDSMLDVKNKKGSQYQIKTILLVNHLLKFHNRVNKTFISGSNEELVKYLNLPREVSDRFLALFCVPTYDHGRAGFSTSKQLKDRRVIYILIMYLMAHGPDMKIGSITQLCEDMMLETKDAMNLYREAGCICSKNKSGMVSVSLKVPLKFPPPKRGKKT